MPESVVVPAIVAPKLLPLACPLTPAAREAGDPPPPFATWCDWARDGLAKALEGQKQAGGGVLEYHIGSRGLKRESSAAQLNTIAYWNELVQLYCGTAGLPTSVTGRDTAMRVILRDV